MRLRRLALAFSIFVVGASCARHRTVSTPEGPAVGGAVPHADDAADPAPPALRLSDDVRPTRYALELTIVPEQTAFQGHVAIEATVAKSAKVVWLNATGLDITRASLSGREARVIKANDDFIGLTTDHELSEGPLIIDVAYTGTIDREKSRGIYAEQEGSDWYVYTFFESIDARRALPCFDQPDAKVPWQLTFHVKADHVALANAAVLSETPEANGMKTVVIAESKPMPSYLVAFVVGPFEIVDGGAAGRVKTPIRFIVPKGRSSELSYAREVTPRVVVALENYFDMDYPYGKLDVAVVPRYWGTMEHPGLVAMGQPLTLIKPLEETRRRKESYTNILAHELTHYWFGDYVTMAWWDDTWLNEALGEWLDATITDQTEPGWKFLDRRPDRAGWAMSTDEQLSTKAMRQPVDTKEAIQGSFDNAITYMKGQTVLSMFESFVGPEKWRDFIRSYVRTFAWKNASADDFLDSMSASLGPRIADAFRTFLRQPGVPLIEHRLKCEGTPYLELHQKRALPVGTVESEARAWDVPVCVRYGAKGDADGARRSCVLLTGAHGNLPLDGACPSWVLMNAGGVGYYRSRYGKGELATLIGKDAQAKTTTAERGTLLKDVDAAVARDQLGIADAMAMVPAVLADPDERIRRQAAVLFNKLDPNVLDDDTYARYQRWILATFGPTARDLGWRRREGDSDERQELRADVLPLVARAGDKPLRSEAERAARAWLSDPSALEDDVVDSVLWTAARNGDAALFNQLLAQARVEKDRVRQQRLLGALGGFLDETLVMRALDLVFDKSFDVRETVAIVYFVAYTRETHDLAFRYVEQNVDKLLGAMRNDEASWFIGGFSSAFCDERHRKGVAALFSPRVGAIEGAEYTLNQGLETAQQCIVTQARIVPGAIQFLAGY